MILSHKTFRQSALLLALTLSVPLAGCSYYQSDEDFFGHKPAAKTLMADSLQKAHQLRLEKKYGQAVKILSQLVLANPDNAPVLAEYGKTLTEQGRAAEAQDFLKRALELRPGDWTLYSTLGVALDQLNMSDDARKAYTKALELKPNEASVLNNYALSRLMAGDVISAQTLILQAMKAGNTPRIASNAQLIGDVSRSGSLPAKNGSKNPLQKAAEDSLRTKIQNQNRLIIRDPETGPEPQPRPSSE